RLRHHIVETARRVPELTVGLFAERLELAVQLDGPSWIERGDDVGGGVVPRVAPRIDVQTAVPRDGLEARLGSQEAGVRSGAAAVGGTGHRRRSRQRPAPAQRPTIRCSSSASSTSLPYTHAERTYHPQGRESTALVHPAAPVGPRRD